MTKKTLFKSIFIGILFLLSYTVTFIHINQVDLTEWEPYSANKKFYKEIVKEANLSTLAVIKDMKSNGLDVYASRLENINDTKKRKHKEFLKTKNKLKEDYSFLGYTSKKIFLYDFGKSLFSLISVVLLIIIILNPYLLKSLRSFLIVGVFGFLYVSFFWVIHNLFAKTDFGKWTYVSSFIVGAVLSTLLTFSLIYLFSLSEIKKRQRQENLKNIINSGNELIDIFKKSV